MNDLQIFNNSEFGEVRTILDPDDSEPKFCLSDICRVLELTSTSKVRERLNPKGVNSIPTPTDGGIQLMTYVNESNLYKVIFQSRKESAERFSDWVTSEVLPSIRKNGGYIAGQETLTPEQIVANALLVAQKIIDDKDKLIENMKPKADFFDAVADSKTAVSMNDVAKVLNVKGYGRNKLFEFLRNQKILDSYNKPYQQYVDCGWFRVIEQRYTRNGEECINFKTLVYQKGIDAIRKRLEKGAA